MDLIEAVRENNLDAVNQLLLNPRIDLNVNDENGNTALIYAAGKGYDAIGL